MDEKNIIEYLQNKIPWKKFLDVMEKEGFTKFHSIIISEITKSSEFEKAFNSGLIMLVRNQIQAGTIRDPSHLHLSPYVVFRPKTENQLQKIVEHSSLAGVPITFASGKTGLSGGYANYGIIVDLADLHSFKKNITLNLNSETVIVEQSVLISDLIKKIPHMTDNKYIFPIQPASAYKLPVRIGGLISSNASGITSGKLGSVEDWLITMRVMKPDGNIVELTKDSPLYKKVIGGNGFFGIVLSAQFKLYKPSSNLRSAIFYGYEIKSAFDGLQFALESKIFPLISEFVISPEILPGKFKELSSQSSINHEVKWAVFIKGSISDVDNFIKRMVNRTNCSWKNITEEEFQEYLQERSSFALLIQTSDDSNDYIAFPGFEDILSEPKNLPEIIKTINDIFSSRGFHEVIFGYGHINFRKGQGLLLHMRLPVPINYFYKEEINKLNLICETVYEVIIALKERFSIRHKAEHSPGPFQIWLDEKFRKIIRDGMKTLFAFNNPHLFIFDELLRRKFKNQIENSEDLIRIDENLSDRIKKDLFVSAMRLYLS